MLVSVFKAVDASVPKRNAAAPQFLAERRGAERTPAVTLTLPRPADLEFSVVTTRAGLDALEEDWNALFERSARGIHVFQSFNWIWHWANHFLPRPSTAQDSAIFILTARRNDRLVMVWPMQRRRRAGLVHMCFMGEPVTQYADLLIDDLPDRDQVLDHAWAYLEKNSGADVFAFRKVRADSNVTQLLSRCGAVVTCRQIAPALDLSSAPDFATYETRYTAKARKNRRRLLRRFEERAPAVVQSLTGGKQAGELAELAITLKRAWLKDRGLFSAALSNPATRHFFRDVAQADTHPVGAVITSLESRGEPAAIEIAFDCKQRRAVHVIVYALKYERTGAGQLLMERSLRDAFAKRLDVYDLLAPGDSYKLDWADGSIAVLDYALGTSPLGRTFARYYLGIIRPRLKTALNTTARLWRRPDGKNRHNAKVASPSDAA